MMMMSSNVRSLVISVIVTLLLVDVCSSFMWQIGGHRRRRCRRQDCQLAPWSQWNACSHPCGGQGRQSRVRLITQRPLCGGRACNSTIESRACNNFCYNGGSLVKPLRLRIVSKIVMLFQRALAYCVCREGMHGVCCQQPERGIGCINPTIPCHFAADMTIKESSLPPYDTESVQWLRKPSDGLQDCSMKGVIRMRLPVGATGFSVHLVLKEELSLSNFDMGEIIEKDGADVEYRSYELNQNATKDGGEEANSTFCELFPLAAYHQPNIHHVNIEWTAQAQAISVVDYSAKTVRQHPVSEVDGSDLYIRLNGAAAIGTDADDVVKGNGVCSICIKWH